MRKIKFEDLHLYEQVRCVYSWYYRNDIYSQPPQTLVQICNKYEFFNEICEHFYWSRKGREWKQSIKKPKMHAHSKAEELVKFLKDNEINTIDQIDSPTLTLIKLTVLK